MKKVVLLLLLILAGIFAWNYSTVKVAVLPRSQITPLPAPDLPDMAIAKMRARQYPASEINLEETLPVGINYRRYIASYTSDGLKIYGLLTVPVADKPAAGWPAVILLHGYLDPKTYQTTARYVAYQDRIAAAGYVTFKPDLRGHGKSEGQPVNSNFSPEYVYDTLNLLSALKKYPPVNGNSLGMWGHSNGGGITLRAMVVSRDIKAGVIWAGVVGNYDDLLVRYRSRIPWMNNRPASDSAGPINSLVQKYGNPAAGSPFWSQVDPYNYLSDLSGPIQLHHGLADESVPIELSRHLDAAVKSAGKISQLYEYPGGDHNISGTNFTLAMDRTVQFFDHYLK